MKKVIFIIIALILIIIAGFLLWYRFINPKNITSIKPMACTQEAKICPDGSSVSRTGPNCEFAPCPTVQVDSNWLTSSDPAQKISFRYPKELGTKYISTQEWPPKINASDQSFSCAAATESNIPYETNLQKMINGKTYCLKEDSEGAAGSIYNTYTYSVQSGNKLVSINFALRFVQCGNYPEPQLTECNNERQAFDLDSLIDQIANTIIIK